MTAHKASSHQQQRSAASRPLDMVLIVLSSAKKCSKICQAEQLNTTSFLFSLSSHCLYSSVISTGVELLIVYLHLHSIFYQLFFTQGFGGLGFLFFVVGFFWLFCWGFFFYNHMSGFLYTAVVTRHSELTVREREHVCCHRSFVVQFWL